MSQSSGDFCITPELFAAILKSLGDLEAHFAGLVTLDSQQRRELSKMGGKSEAFCRQAAVAFDKHPEALPGDFNLEGFRNDLVTMDGLRPIMTRVSQLYLRLIDTEMAIGSDLMHSALEGYAVLKLAGKGERLEVMRGSLSARLNQGRTQEVREEKPSRG